MQNDRQSAPLPDGREERLKRHNEAVETVRQNAGRDAERIRAERERLDEELEKKKRVYEEIRASEQSFLDECAGKAERIKRPARPSRERRGGLGILGTIRLVVSAVILLAFIYLFVRYFPVIKGLVKGETVSFSDIELPSTIEDMMPDEALGYNQVDFQNAILGEAREKSSLVVLEQDVIVDSQISQAIANISLFQKTKTIHSYGTGVYAVDLAGLTEESVTVDMGAKTVLVLIPHATLQYINIDPALTTFEDTERAILAFGDIALTSEQQQILETSIKSSMEEKLNRAELFNEADRLAVGKIADLFTPLVKGVAEDFTLLVRQSD